MRYLLIVLLSACSVQAMAASFSINGAYRRETYRNYQKTINTGTGSLTVGQYVYKAEPDNAFCFGATLQTNGKQVAGRLSADAVFLSGSVTYVQLAPELCVGVLDRRGFNAYLAGGPEGYLCVRGGLRHYWGVAGGVSAGVGPLALHFRYHRGFTPMLKEAAGPGTQGLTSRAYSFGISLALADW